MSEKVNPDFINTLKKLGAFDINACYSCGNCTAICPLSNEKYSFPRSLIRYSILGLEKRILKSPDIWLCYYCGECSDTCPREADPGGLMMSLRRYVIRKYSLGKIADIFYSKFSSLITWLFLTIAAIVGVIIFHNPHPNLEKAEPLSFITLNFLHDAGIILGIFIGFFAFIHIFIMAKNVDGEWLKNNPIIWGRTFFNTLFREIFIQNKFNECTEKMRYISHLALFWGFAGLFLATILVFGVDFFGFPENFRIVAKILGLITGVALVYGSGYYIFKRIFIKDSYSKYSHFTDWIFIFLLFFSGLTGFFLDIFKWLNLPWPTYITFAIHLVIVFDLLISAPFTKFAHAIYRPLAIWFTEMGEKVGSVKGEKT